MREGRRPGRRRGVIAATVAAGLLVVAPGAAAQQADEDAEAWEGSSFTEPSSDGTSAVRSFPIAGTFIDPGRTVSAVEVDFGRLDGDVYSEADEDPCVPADPGVVPDTPGNGLDRYDFTVRTPDGENITWPCNGRYLIRAHATSEGVEGTRTHVLTRTVDIAEPPPPVQTVNAVADGERVFVTWDPIRDPSADAAGYRVERAGPKKDGAFGPFVAVSGDLGTDSTSVTDRPEVSGDYRYRVLALRHGADEPVTAPPDESASADVSVTVPTTTTTRAEGSGGSIPSVGSGRPTSRAPRRSAPQIPAPSPPTTIDTGFEPELDYGDRSGDRELDDAPELADGGEGQSIIRTEGDGAGLVAPAAGALVLLGWAGHVVYLNRLAKQF